MRGEVNEFAFWGKEMSNADMGSMRMLCRRLNGVCSKEDFCSQEQHSSYEQCTCLFGEFVWFNQNRMHLLIELYGNMSSHLR